MKGWYPVFRKEMANFFTSPIAYVVIASFLLISGFFFWANVSLMSLISLQATHNPMISEKINLSDLVIRPLVQNMSIVLLFLLPLLTMRLFSEEKKVGSIELLLTYPITDLGVLAGKFFAATALLLIMLALTASYSLILFVIADPDWGVFLSGYVGLILMGLAFISMGVFVSSLTENQIVAAAITFGTALMFWIISWTSTFAGETMGIIIRQLSILEHLDSFHKGIISLSDLSFFVLFSAFFLFLTLQSLEANRWRG
jgi:ABC-2 type transport system permease protein